MMIASAAVARLAPLVCLVFINLGSALNEDASARLSENVVSLLRSHGASGGIVEYIACTPNNGNFDLQGDTIKSQLNSLPTSAQLRWHIISASNTYFIEIGDRSPNNLLDTPLPALTVNGDTLSQESNYLLSYPPVALKAKQFGIRSFDRDFGFSSIKNAAKLYELRMPEGTLAEDLNRLAAQQPGAVWYLSQRSCENRVVDSFSWASL